LVVIDEIRATGIISDEGMELLIVKKQADNLDLLTAFTHDYPDLAGKSVLIIDDEADLASIGFRGNQKDGLQLRVNTGKINRLGSVLKDPAFLQVTATPYALYVQPPDLIL
jgi:hypothetical protein